jgi:hypothetical protein
MQRRTMKIEHADPKSIAYYECSVRTDSRK